MSWRHQTNATAKAGLRPASQSGDTLTALTGDTPPGALYAAAASGLPSRLLADRAFALAERLGSVNAAAAQLGTTWPSRRKASQRHGLGMPAGNPEAVCQHAIDAARQRTAPGHPEP